MGGLAGGQCWWRLQRTPERVMMTPLVVRVYADDEDNPQEAEQDEGDITGARTPLVA